MDGLLNYIIINYNLIICLSLIMFFHSNIGNKSTKSISIAILILIVLTIVDSLEQWTRTFEEFIKWRVFLSFMGYSIRPIILFMSIACISAGIIEAVNLASNLLNTTIASSFSFYCLFMYIQISKRDPLTGLLNRQLFYSYCNRNKNKILEIVVIDMNDLKLINDSKGHSVGDNALCELGECFKFYINRNVRVYRMGGD